MKIELNDEDFGTLAICAIRYCQGRRTYMPDLVRSIVRPQLKKLTDKSLVVLINDCEDQRRNKIPTLEKMGVKFSETLKDITKTLIDRMSIEVDMRIHGDWIISENGEYAECSECKGRSGTQFDGVEPIPLMTRYCPHCEAIMKRGVRDETFESTYSL